jgi:glucose/mannose-6-phosphate isomerase
MLDDLKRIAQLDTDDALGLAERQVSQLKFSFDFKFKPEREIKNIVVSGMGGSALAASMIVAWPAPKVPFIVNRQYAIPGFVGKDTLFVASSYSGNTEETLQALSEAREANAQIFIITANGQLEEIARENNYAMAKIPRGLQPRMAVWYNYRALLELLEAAGIESGLIDELESAADLLQQAASQWQADVPTSDNLAKQIAEKVMGRTPVIYAGPALSAAAYKWKISFNENAKNVAFYNQFPEFNHNEFIGWSSHPVEKPFQPIELRSELEDERVNKRFDVTNKMLSGLMPAAVEVYAEGSTKLEHLLWTIMLGDFVSLYTAMLNGVNPTPVDLVEKFKKELSN